MNWQFDGQAKISDKISTLHGIIRQNMFLKCEHITEQCTLGYNQVNAMELSILGSTSCQKKCFLSGIAMRGNLGNARKKTFFFADVAPLIQALSTKILAKKIQVL